MYRFLFSRRWLGYFVLAAFFATVAAGLGVWQMERRAEVVQNITRITNNYSAAPISFEAAKPVFSQFDQAKEWTQVQLTGSYQVSDQRVVRNRPLNGQPGYEVVIPFRLVTGETVIIDRGWLPIGNQEAGRPDLIPEPVSGQITVVGRLKPSEPELARGAPEGQIASINLPAYAQELSYPVLTGAYLQMAQETPAAAQNPAGFLVPSVNEGTNLSYAMQWFAFGVLFFIGFGYIAFQQAKLNRLEAEGGLQPEDELGRGSAFQNAAKAAARRHRRQASAEQEEDAMLDAQGFEGGQAPMRTSPAPRPQAAARPETQDTLRG